MLYTLRFFSSKCSFFHNANLFGFCIIHILYTGCAEIKKKNNSDAKGLNVVTRIFDKIKSKTRISHNITDKFVLQLLESTKYNEVY